MSPVWIYYLWATLFVVVCVLAWAANLFALPGNWGIVVAAALFALGLGVVEGRGIGWWAVMWLLALAVVGEIVEFLAGAAGAKRLGGSRRGMALAVVGAVVGSVTGAIIGIPVPIIGPIVAAVGGGAAGAFAGAYLGEQWKGRTSADSVEIGKGALIGRLLGTVGKMAIGAIMLIVATIAAYSPAA
ncbi:MAG: DUF456 family protein [Planctomycetaceae bacterium]